MNGRPEETDMIAVDEQMLASLKLDTEKNSQAVHSESHPYHTKKINFQIMKGKIKHG